MLMGILNFLKNKKTASSTTKTYQAEQVNKTVNTGLYCDRCRKMLSEFCEEQ